MLQNEPENQQSEVSSVPAAQIRVSSEELTAAINALEQESAQNLQGTVPIGQVVQELNLNATSEEIWAQVQKQRRAVAEKAAAATAAEQAAAERTAAEQAAAAQAAQTNAYSHWGQNRQWRGNGFPSRRRGRLWVLIGVCWAGYVIAHGNPFHIQTLGTSPSSIVITGDNETLTYNVEGKAVEIDGDNCRVILHGKPSSVTVSGDNDTVITDQAENVKTSGSRDTVQQSGSTAPSISNSGDNSISPDRH